MSPYNQHRSSRRWLPRILFMLPFLLGGCESRTQALPAFAHVMPPWKPIGINDSSVMSIDTSRIEAAAGSEAFVWIRYDFAEAIPLQPDSGGPPIGAYVVEGYFLSDCARSTARTLRVLLRDSTGRELLRVPRRRGEVIPNFLGGGGPALCEYLRRRPAGAAGS